VPPRSIQLALDPSKSTLGVEGYELTVTRDGVTLTAAQPNGLFYGVQTIRQLLPWSVEHRAAMNRRLWLPAARVTDTPRFAWRGAMLDVSRHFIDAEAVKRYIDLMAVYKLNRLHLHLSDDQGWRIEIASRPNLTAQGGSTQGERRAGRLLHEGAVCRHRRLRDQPIHYDRARDRHALAYKRGAGIVRGAQLR
jgi:hexosaminidase